MGAHHSNAKNALYAVAFAVAIMVFVCVNRCAVREQVAHTHVHMRGCAMYVGINAQVPAYTHLEHPNLYGW